MRMPGRNPIRRCVDSSACALLIAALLSSCSSGGSEGGGQSTSLGSVFAGRPKVSVSVAEAYPGSGVEQLDFFDTLEKRDLVSHDDALHASLLLFAGQSGQTFVQRAGRAKQMGMLDPKFDRPPREAVTVGEFAQLVAGGMKRPSATSESSAVSDLKEIGVLPDFVGENSGVSGAQLLTILGHAEDAIAGSQSSSVHGEGDALRPMNDDERKHISPGIFAAPPPAHSPGQPAGQPGDKKPVKKPPIDLEKDAKKPRPGQVLPDGTTVPAETAPATPEPGATPTPANPTPTPAPAPAPRENPTPSTGPKPLSPPRADGGVPSRVDGIASDLRYVAVDRVSVNVTEVLGPGELVQWRVVDDGRGRPGDWQTLQPGDPISDRIEVRTGIGARVSMVVEESTSVILHRLTRARIERKIRSDGQWQIGVTIYHGMLEATGTAADRGAAVLVRTPDQVFPLRTRALFEYDAFKGTIAREFRP
jgi:hypothetical protein